MKKIERIICSILISALLGAATAVFASELPTIADLNTNSSVGSHATDYYKTASVELNYRELVNLNSQTTGSKRYDIAYYPRVKKVRDDFYFMLFSGGQVGPHIYWATSSDGFTWNSPEVFYNGGTADKKFVHTEGPLAGQTDNYMGCNADAVVLDNGDILVAYYERPSHGYAQSYIPYLEMNKLYIVRGTVDGDTIRWGKRQAVYTGSGWEPYIHKLADGRLQLVWTSVCEYHAIYGFDEVHRSDHVMMIESEDNGYTWVPTVEKGNQNNYVALRIYKEYIGDRIPEVEGKSYTEAVPYFAGQMPVMTTLYNGRTLLAIETRQIDLSLDLSFALSEKDGSWKSLGFYEEGPEDSYHRLFDGAAPYLSCFPSGEVYLTYHWGGSFFCRLGSPEGTEYGARLTAVPGRGGMWGSSELIDSHTVLTAFQVKYGENWGIQLGRSYLNHRTNAKKLTPNIDGNIDDWDGNTDALFVGSESQAQITVQTAHDDDNVYFLISRLDDYLTRGDTTAIHISAGSTSFYTVTADSSGACSITETVSGVKKDVSGDISAAVKIYGTVDDNSDLDEGMLIELAVPKSLVGLVGASSFAIRPELTNVDGTGCIIDTLTGVSHYSTLLWPEVKLDN